MSQKKNNDKKEKKNENSLIIAEKERLKRELECKKVSYYKEITKLCIESSRKRKNEEKQKKRESH